MNAAAPKVVRREAESGEVGVTLEYVAEFEDAVGEFCQGVVGLGGWLDRHCVVGEYTRRGRPLRRRCE